MAGNKGVAYLGPGRVEVQDLDYPAFELSKFELSKEAATEHPATVLNTLMKVVRAGGGVGIPGLYVTGDPGASDPAAREGPLSLRLGLGWSKSPAFFTGQCPVMKYNRELMMAILNDRVSIARNVNATPIPLEQAPQGYQEFDKGAAKKYVLDPNGCLGTKAA